MNSEFLKLDTVEKIAKYDKLVLERKNIIRYLKNQIKINKESIEKYTQTKDKNMVIIQKYTINLYKEILKIMNEEV